MDPDYLRDLFEPFGDIDIRRMFGGQGVYFDGLMFALVADGELYLKVDDTSKAEFSDAGSAPFTYTGKGKSVEMSYWRLPEDALDDPDAMKQWADLGYAAALRAKVKKSAKKPAKTSKKITKTR